MNLLPDDGDGDGEASAAAAPVPDPVPTGEVPEASKPSPPRRRRRSVPRARPGVVVVLALVYLALALTAVVLVDVVGLGRGALVEALPRRPSLWINLFEDGSPTELLQWSALGAIVVLAGIQSGRAVEVAAARFWRLVAVGVVLMLMEDAGNVRHRLAFYTDAVGLLEGDGPWHLAVEAVWFGTIALVLAYALVRYGRRVPVSPAARMYALGGAAAYAVAVTMSATRDIGWWYADAGRVIQERLLRTELLLPAGWSEAHGHFFLMDYVVEETLELIGAALLLAAVLAYRRDLAVVTPERPVRS